MPKVSTIPEIIGMEVDEVIISAKGKLKSLFKPTTGKSDKGAWSFQNGELTDGKNTIKVTFKDMDEVPQSMKGNDIYLIANHGEHGWTGLKRKDNEYKGEVSPVLWVTKTAEMVLARDHTGGEKPEAGEEVHEEEAPQPMKSLQHAHPTPHSTTARPAQSVDEVAAVRVFIARRSSGMKLCLKAAHNVCEEFMVGTKVQVEADFLQKIASSLFIDASRAGQLDSLPVNINYTTGKPAVKQQKLEVDDLPE